MEKYTVLSATCRGSFWERLCHLYMKTGDYVDMENLENRHLVYVRVFLSDIRNQYATLLESQLWQDYLSQVPCSVIGQAPLNGSKVSLLVCTSDVVDNPLLSRVRLSEDDVDGKDTYEQALMLFRKFVGHVFYNDKLCRFSGMRVWLYMANISNNIEIVEKAFDDVCGQYGFHPDERRVAVTCIEGTTHVEGAVVALDYIIFSEPAKPVVPLHIKYRGEHAAIPYNSCSESIGIKYGNTLRVELSAFSFSAGGDYDLAQLDARQLTGLLLGDIGVRLKSYDVTMNDVCCFVVYLRDFSDYDDVDRLLSMAFPDIPHVIVGACGPNSRQPVFIGCVAYKLLRA